MTEAQTTTKIRNNPYVGPRPFNRGETLYGRNREVSKLLNLLIAERIVMLYSPSGAGKTSLLLASLIPRLEKKRFAVLPIMRVNQELPQDEAVPAGTNRYVYSLLDYLERDLPEAEQITPPELAQLTLVEYLERRRSGQDDPARTVLVFDQFEEILTTDPTNIPGKQAFFEQVGEALHQRWVWAVFSLREDYIAGLDPYLLPIPNRLNTTFRLELLDKTAARQAMQGPANERDVTFTGEAADKLVDDLSLVRVQQRDGTIEEKEGRYVEPVQLQVVCRRLWDEKFRPGLVLEEGTIEVTDVERVGDVDTALAGYYDERVKAIAGETGISERAIRDWCGETLITETGIRGQVLSGPNQGLADAAVQGLVDAHLVRGEERRNATWYELAHDRLIEPAQENNTAWEVKHLHPLQRQAALWNKAQRPDGLLLTGDELAAATEWAVNQKLEDFETDFLEASQKAQAVVDRERRLNRLIRYSFLGMLVLFIIALVIAYFAWSYAEDAQEQRATAVAAVGNAATARAAADAADQQVLAARLTAEAAQEAVALAQLEGTPNVEQQATASAANATATAAIVQAEATRNKANEAVADSLAAVSTPEASEPDPTATPIGTPTPLPSNTPTIIEATQTAIAISVSNDLIQITHDGDNEEWVPSFSPDQRSLVIQSNRYGNKHQLFTLTADGQHLDGDSWQQLTDNNADHFHPRFSPDGNVIAFTSDLDGDWEVYTISADGSNLRNLTNSPGLDRFPSFSQDGRKIVFESARNGTSGVFIMNSDGTDQHPVIDTSAEELFPYISPDGQFVTYYSYVGGNWEIYIVAITGGEPTRLTTDPARDADPVFSPDGRTIAFETNRDGDYEIYVMDVDGSNLRNLTQFPDGNDQVPAFSPDGRWVVFQSDRNGSWDIYMIPLQEKQISEAEQTQTATAQAQQITPSATILSATATPTVISTATSIPAACTDGPLGEFESTWEKYKERLGCPLQVEPTIYGNFAEQQFENGFMFWSEFQDKVLAVDTYRQVWFPAVDNWSFVPNSAACADQFPTGQPKAINAFGGVWCDNPEIREALGFPIASERGMGGGIQEFDRGWILRNDDQSRQYVLFEDDMSVTVEEK